MQRRQLRHSAPLLLMTLVLATRLSSASDWNQWRGPDRNGLAESSPPLIAALPEAGLNPAWMSENIPSAWDGGWGSPVVSKGQVFLFVHSRHKREGNNAPKRKYPWVQPEDRTSWTDEEFEAYEKKRRDEDEAIGKSIYEYRETLYSIDAASGKTLWTSEQKSVYTRFLQSGTPTVHGDRVYALGGAYTVRCFDTRTRKQVWSKKLPGEFRDEFQMASLLVEDGIAVVQSGQLFGLDVETGKIVWTLDASRVGTHSSPALWSQGNQKRVIANVKGGVTLCLDLQTGREIWSVQSEAGLSTPVVIGDQLLTFGNSRKKGMRSYRLTSKGAEELWVYQKLSDDGSSPVVVGQHVFVQGGRRFACVDLASGETRWTSTIQRKDPRFTSLVAADDKIFYSCEGLLVIKASPVGFEPLFDAKVTESGKAMSKQALRRMLDLDKIEAEEDGRKKANRLWQDKVESHGPLKCASPAFVDGFLIIRRKNGLVCYDMRAPVES